MSCQYTWPAYASVFQTGWQANNATNCTGEAKTPPQQQVATASAPGGAKVKKEKKPGRLGPTVPWVKEVQRFIPTFIPVNEEGYYILVRVFFVIPLLHVV